jgi:U3 small nucleolar RNA-associated protein 5
MSVKKSSRGAISKTSSTIAAASSSTTNNNQKSSILKSAFSPSRLQLSLFASVIQGFESQHLRIHDTDTGRLRCEHAAGAGTRITSLDWGYYGTTYRDQHLQTTKKKRKRGLTNTGSAVVAFGTSQSEICMFSPSEGKVVGKLSGQHERGIKDFKFCGNDYLGGWSVGGEGKLVQWDLGTGKAIR